MRRRNFNYLFIPFFIISVVFMSCDKNKDDDSSGNDNGKAVTGVTLDEANITIKVGEIATLTATVHPNDADNQVVNWTSSDMLVATVVNGKVTAIKEGTVTITVITEDGNYTAECTVIVEKKGVVINGVTWATRNVDKPGTFAANPEEAGMFYQWNRKIGWSTIDPLINSDGGTTWDSSSPEGNTWEKVNDPCPPGWRVPTVTELESLVKAGSQWTTINGKKGRVFGNDDNSIFLPAAGFRFDGSLYLSGSGGCYWNSTNVRCLNFHSGAVGVVSNDRDFGFSVRCVAE